MSQRLSLLGADRDQYSPANMIVRHASSRDAREDVGVIDPMTAYELPIKIPATNTSAPPTTT
jgi:hypothetical protein